MRETILYLKSILKENDTVVIGVSGGPDSMCLLSFLDEKIIGVKLNIIVAHVNHNVRIESASEEEFVKEFATSKKYIFESLKLPKIEGNFEAEARKLRYRFFEKLVDKYNAKYLFTAHHGDDLVETIIMRLIRGSSFKGYHGIDLITKVKNYYLVRPLLYMNKKEILAYLDSKKISYCLDKTNDLNFNTRNRIRHFVLPSLQKENGNVHLKFLEFSQKITAISDFMDNYVNCILAKIYLNNRLNLLAFKELDPLIQKMALEIILQRIYNNDLYLITNSNCKEILKLINSCKPNGKVKLPNNVNFIKEYNILYLAKDKHKIMHNPVEFTDLVNYNGFVIKKVAASSSKSNYVTRLLTSEIKLPLYVRTRQDGDFMVVKNMFGKKKIKDIFINEKIALDKRDELPIVVDSNNTIIWIPGVKKSKFDKEKNEKYDIILKCEKEGEIYE